MNPLGEPDRLYVEARRVLLDALQALTGQHHALILVGAQAIYLRVGAGDVAVAPHTTDADLVVLPNLLQGDPRLEKAMRSAGLWPSIQPGAIGTWVKEIEPNVATSVDLLVPEGLAAPGGRRGARLGAHGNDVARKARGLEATAVDNDIMIIGALDPHDLRTFEMPVAGPAALLVAKLHKLGERIDKPDRLEEKDALDIFRLLQLEVTDIAPRIEGLLLDHRAATITQEAMQLLRQLFGQPEGRGCQMAGDNVFGVGNPDEVARASHFLAIALLDALQV